MWPSSTPGSSNQLTATLLLHHHQCLDSMRGILPPQISASLPRACPNSGWSPIAKKTLHYCNKLLLNCKYTSLLIEMVLCCIARHLCVNRKHHARRLGTLRVHIYGCVSSAKHKKKSCKAWCNITGAFSGCARENSSSRQSHETVPPDHFEHDWQYLIRIITLPQPNESVQQKGTETISRSHVAKASTRFDLFPKRLHVMCVCVCVPVFQRLISLRSTFFFSPYRV